MKYPITVEAVCVSKLGEFIADESEIRNDSEWDQYRERYARYIIRPKKKRKRRPILLSLVRRYWWTIPVLLLVLAIVVGKHGFGK